jgi:hypothetical protein
MATAPITEPDAALDQAEVDGDSARLQEIHKRAIRRFDETVLPQQEQRALALLSRRFVDIAGAQWEGEWGDQFANSIKVEIDKVADGVDKIVRDYRENRIVPDFRPAGASSDQETADTLDGMHRADSYHFKAQQARDNAFEEAVKGGFGAYRLTNEWADPYDKDSDAQRINPALTIVDADQRVFFDGNSKLYDKSDARFAFVLTGMTPDAYQEAYGDERPTSWPDAAQRTSQYDWYSPEAVIVCEYYEVEDRNERLLIFTHALTNDEQRWWSSEIDTAEIEALKTKGWTMRERRQKRRRIHKYTMSGAEVLRDNGFLAGDCIPVVPVYGKRAYVDGQERFRGYVLKKMDRQRVYNSQVSKLAETAALSPREKPIFDADQMPPNLQALWAEQEIARHPYALVKTLYHPVTGDPIAMGPIGKVEPPQLPPVAAALLQIAGNDLTEDMQEADEVKANTSAEAMDIAATRVDAKSGIYLDNMRQSVQREGEVYLSMCRDIYWEPGRVIETMSEDGDDGQAVLQESVTDREGLNRIRNDFTKGRYKVVVAVTEATATRRDKAIKSSLRVAEVAVGAQNMELANVAILTAVMNQDGEGTADLQKWARKQLLAQGVVEPNEEERAAMEKAAEQEQQPDPANTVLLAQAEALVAQAEKDKALAGKAEADTGLSEAKTVEALASAQAKGADPVQPANDVEPRPRIRTGRELAG